MSPKDFALYEDIPMDYKTAAVMVLLHNTPEETRLALIQRNSTNQNDRHAGQISFPGGKMDASDSDLEACAYRETFEEIGVPPENISILGRLSPLYVFVSNFMVYPFVGFCKDKPIYIKELAEVDHVFDVAIADLLKQEPPPKIDVNTYYGTIKNVPYYDVNGSVLWGATAMITAEFLDALKNNITAL